MVTKNTAMALTKFIISCIIAVAILSGFVLAFSYDGIHLTNAKCSTDYKWRSNEPKTTITEGFAWIQMDDNGFNNISTTENIEVLMMGSSHMEAAQIPQTANCSNLVGKILSYNSYNIGISGHTIYRCVDNYYFALKEFNPVKYSVIETSSIDLSIKEMQSVIAGKAQKLPSYDEGIIYYLQLIPAFRPVYRQLENWVALENPIREGVSQANNSSVPEGYAETLHQFLSIVSNTAKENGITPIIFYHPSEKLNSDGSIRYKTDSLYLDCFAATCDQLGIVFIDMTDSFKDLYAGERQLAHGFINTAVGSGHLNQYGHRVIAEKLAEVIQGLEAE